MEEDSQFFTQVAYVVGNCVHLNYGLERMNQSRITSIIAQMLIYSHHAQNYGQSLFRVKLKQYPQ